MCNIFHSRGWPEDFCFHRFPTRYNLSAILDSRSGSNIYWNRRWKNLTTRGKGKQWRQSFNRYRKARLALLLEDLPPNLDPINSSLFYYTAPPSGTRRILHGDSYWTSRLPIDSYTHTHTYTYIPPRSTIYRLW